MVRNSLRSVFTFVVLAVVAFFVVAYLWVRLQTSNYPELHSHGQIRTAHPCFQLQIGLDESLLSGQGTIQDCLLLEPDGSALDLVEVHLDGGLLILAKTDTSLAGSPLALTRVYRPEDKVGPFGYFSEHVYNIFPVGDTDPYSYIDLCFYDGMRIHYDRESIGLRYGAFAYKPGSAMSRYNGSQMRWNGHGWELTRRDGWSFEFPEAKGETVRAKASLTGIRTPEGHTVSLKRESSGDLTRIESGDGKWIALAYSNQRIVRVEDSSGRTVDYEYDDIGRLLKVQNGDRSKEYAYDQSHRVVSVSREGKAPFLQVAYNSNGMVSSLTLPDGGSFQFLYRRLDRDTILTEVIRPNGERATVTVSLESYVVTPWR